MNNRDPALIFSNPRLLATVYYGLLSVVGTILIDAFLSILGIEDIVPLFQSIILGMVVASITGALFGKLIIHCPRPYMLKTFLIGFIMVLLSLPFFDFGLLFFMGKAENPVFKIASAHDWVATYFIVLGYSYILFGFLLAIAAGLASMYLRDQLVYHVLYTDRRRSHRLPRYIAERDKTKLSQKTHSMQRKKT